VIGGAQRPFGIQSIQQQQLGHESGGNLVKTRARFCMNDRELSSRESGILPPMPARSPRFARLAP
jgi:hypothetical protein